MSIHIFVIALVYFIKRMNYNPVMRRVAAPRPRRRQIILFIDYVDRLTGRGDCAALFCIIYIFNIESGDSRICKYSILYSIRMFRTSKDKKIYKFFHRVHPLCAQKDYVICFLVDTFVALLWPSADYFRPSRSSYIIVFPRLFRYSVDAVATPG